MIGRIIPIFHAQFPLPATSHSSRSRVKGTVSDNRSYPTGRVTRSLETFVQLSAANNSWKCSPRWACISPRSKKKTKQKKKERKERARKVTQVSHRASYNANRSAHANIYTKPRISDTTRGCKYLSNTRRDLSRPPPPPIREGRGYTKREARDKGIRSFPVIWNRSLFEIPSGF